MGPTNSILDNAVRGIIVPLITPLEDDDVLDRVALERVIEHVLSGGVSGVFLLGTTGEGPSLSYEVRSQLIDATCQQVAGRVPVLVGVSDNAYERCIAMTRVAERAGAAAVVLAPPSYFRISQPDLLRYVETFAAESPLPVFLYNIPALTKTAYDPQTISRAAIFSRIAGLKDSSGDLDYLASVVRSTGAEFPVLMGPEEILMNAMQAGAVGGVCGAPIYSRVCLSISIKRWRPEISRELRNCRAGCGRSATHYIRSVTGAPAIFVV